MESNVELSSTGRPKRRSRARVDYKMFDDDNVELEELAKQMANQQKLR